MSNSKSLQVSIDQPDQMLAMAKDLATFIKEKNLYTKIQGKAFVNVEGWQYAGSRLGIIPNIEEVVNLSTDQELKYSATVRLINVRTGQQVGSGYAICSNKEGNKKTFQEYAVASMAQTRAIGKAYRNLLAWVLKAVGYEPTPAEEMDFMQEEPQPAVNHPQPPQEQRKAKVNTELPLDFVRDFSKATPAQQQLIYKMMHSHVFTDTDIQYAKDLYYKSSSGPEGASRVIDWLKAEITSRKEAEKAGGEEPAKIKHKTELLLLLSNEHISKEEKDKMILNINKMTVSRIQQAISKLKATIEERSQKQQIA